MRPLGTYTESSSPCGGSKAEFCDKSQRFRRERYALLNVIRRRFIAASDVDLNAPDFEAYNALPRVVKCRRCMVGPTVKIRRDTVRNRAHYSGLTACGSVWSCPVCCAQVQEVRRQEIAQAFAYAYSHGLKAIMVTFTFPHYDFQSCRDLLDRQASAFRYLRSGKRYQSFKQSVGYVGNIRALEVKYGGNGWHPHTHEIFFVDESADAEQIRAFLTQRWEAACDKAGLIPRGKLRAFRARAVDVKDNMSSSDYLAKQDDINNSQWGADRELTGWMLKTSGESVHPFQLAAAGATDRRAWALFDEYCEAFKGRASVFWSRGLKALVGLQESSDEEIAANDPPADEVEEVASLDCHCWRVVKDENAEALLLDIAEQSGQAGVDDWLSARGLHSVPDWVAGFHFSEAETRLVQLHQPTDERIIIPYSDCPF